VSFGVAVITPRWLYVLAAATGTRWGDPHLIDETLDVTDFDTIAQGDVVGIGIHTGNAKRGYEIGHRCRERGAWVVYGGIHATLYPDEAHDHGAAHAVVKGDGDLVWASVVEDCLAGRPAPFVNVERYCNERVDELFRLAAAGTTQAERARHYQAAQEILARELPTVPLIEYGDTHVARGRVKGLFRSLSSHERWDEVWVVDGK
jgi:ABC-type transport system substrate-binding protein